MPLEYTIADMCEDIADLREGIADIREGIADIREDIMALHTGIGNVTQMVQRLEDETAGVQRDIDLDIDDLWRCIIMLGINVLCISLCIDLSSAMNFNYDVATWLY
jgi:hypothetical protein